MKNALIMAAGRGLRLMPLTDSIPKAMAPYAGTTLIADGINKIKDKIENIYITVGYKGAILSNHVIENGVSGVFNTEGKDNAWWIFNTLIKNLNEPVLVLTCDNVVELDLDLIFNEYINFNSPACMVIPVTPVVGLEGDYIYHENNVVTLLSRNKSTDIYCSGIQVLNPHKINHLIDSCDNFYDVWNQLIQIKELYTSNIYPKKWYAVDTMDQLLKINQKL
jgi:NDP-sugar pyrophosphorylase family protein